MSRVTVRGRLSRLRRSLGRLSPLVRGRRWTIAAIAVSSAGSGLAEAGVLALVAYIATDLSGAIETPSLAIGPVELSAPTSVLLVVAAVLAVFRLLFQIAVARLPARLSGEVQTHLRAQLLDSFLMASWAAKSNEKEGHLQELMGAQTTQAGNVVLEVANVFSAALIFLILVASALLISVGVAGAVMAAAAVLFVAMRPLSRRVRRYSAATSAAAVSQASGVAESFRMAEEVQVFDAAEAERRRVKGLVASLEENLVRTRTLVRLVPVVYRGAVICLLILGLALLSAVGANRLATLGAVVLLLLRASSYGQVLLDAYQRLSEAVPYLDRVAEAIDRYRSSARRPGNRPIGSVRSVEFESVSFAYRSSSPVLRDLSFSIRAGEAIGVVGPSGAGKSTLVQLLLGLRAPSAGRYLVNGVRVDEIDDASWHRKVSYLPQEPHLLGGTATENIRFYREWVDDESVEHAARLAHIHTDITSWTDGYREVVGQRADAVSGGQRQRLCLARALAGAPELLILDEPTSALDPESEHLIQESLQGLRGSLTLIIVAHRLTTLRLCDRVMVIRDGYLEAFAPATLLYDSNDFYRRAVDLAAAGQPL